MGVSGTQRECECELRVVNIDGDLIENETGMPYSK